MMNLTSTQKKIIELTFVNKKVTRKFLASKLNVTNAALTLAIKPLLDEKMIEEMDKIKNGKKGKNEILLSLNASFTYFYGIDIRNNYYFTITDFDNNLIVNEKYSNIDDVIKAIKEYHKKYMANSICVTVRGNANYNYLTNSKKEVVSKLEALNIPVCYYNNVTALAYIYNLYHEDDSNFVLIKYGPGVGSSIFINNEPLSSEFGHMLVGNSTLEETISFTTLLGKEYDEIEGSSLLLNSKENINKICSNLSNCLVSANSLLSLDKIIFSGVILSQNNMKEKIEDHIKSICPCFDVSKIKVYEDYESIAMKKSSIMSFIHAMK